MESNAVCKRCGVAFHVTPAKLRYGEGVYCSRDCKYQPTSIAEAFWSRVMVNDEWCWLWIGKVNSTGYGFFENGRRGSSVQHRANRVSWEIHNGAIPPGLLVLHRCDTLRPPGDRTYRRCVRPDHLFLGTHRDNMADMAKKGRAASGERNVSRFAPHLLPHGEVQHSAKLTEDDVRSMRVLRMNGVSSYQIWKRFAFVSYANVKMVLRGETWKHLL